mgnify:FL=1|jgi:hypothetical protein|tara:strand:+ start:152 stop:577 length:426 start_codon:yes stop_codon:yes gene_type:complete
MSTVNISLVPVDEIRNIWENISEYMKKAADYTYGRYTEIDILHECLTHKFNLWVAYKEGPEYIGAACTELIVYPRKKVLSVVFLSGDDFPEWMPEIDQKFVDFAKVLECDFVEACGRAGWERKVKKLGWIKRFTIIERPLT